MNNDCKTEAQLENNLTDLKIGSSYSAPCKQYPKSDPNLAKLLDLCLVYVHSPPIDHTEVRNLLNLSHHETIRLVSKWNYRRETLVMNTIAPQFKSLKVKKR